MLSFLQQVFIGILSTYLALTNTLADRIFEIINGSTDSPELSIAAEATLTPLESAYQNGRLIPKILIENSAYQQAALSTAGNLPQQSAPLGEAMVNIFCQYQMGAYVRSISGTGFFVTDEGVILTNAHVAQFLLLEDTLGDGTGQCSVRTGTPATTTFAAKLLYISPAWVLRHSNLIAVDSPTGTGERDYALLYVTAGVNNQPMPGRLPYLIPHTALLSRDRAGSAVTIGGYPAEAAIQNNTSNALAQRTASSTVIELFTFGSNYADIFSLAGSPIGERGVSGGPVVDINGEAIGLITTRGNDAINGPGSLHAITLSYINRTMHEETGYGFAENISGNLPLRAAIFRETIVPFLKRQLEAAL